ncbi:unnamed protein product [Pleuronectes platessa]|uniref:Uncharacterized protein n=1 Tax=Pleuronectes platessa TaxID=8262 RepID=A0A9N7VDR2_PLEPL|nr:unnamed protein product [Pleuronectes platessa]
MSATGLRRSVTCEDQNHLPLIQRGEMRSLGHRDEPAPRHYAAMGGSRTPVNTGAGSHSWARKNGERQNCKAPLPQRALLTCRIFHPESPEVGISVVEDRGGPKPHQFKGLCTKPELS